MRKPEERQEVEQGLGTMAKTSLVARFYIGAFLLFIF